MSTCSVASDSDDSLFPAYYNYIHGFDTYWRGDNEISLDAHNLFDPPGPIPYTNSMPSRSMVYESASGAHPSHYVRTEPMRTTSIFPVGTFQDDSPQVLDLRSPSLQQGMVKLNPPQAVLASAAPLSALSLPSSAVHGRPESSTEVMKRKLLVASQQQSSYSGPRSKLSSRQPRYAPQHQDRPKSFQNQHRAMAHERPQSSLLRSSSATDVDEHHGSFMIPSDSPTPMTAQLGPLPHHWQHQLAPVMKGTSPIKAQPVAHHMLAPPFVRPGELLTDPRYVTAPENIRQQINAQLTYLWTIVEHHTDPESKKQALAHIAICSAQARRMLVEKEFAQPQAQNWESRSPGRYKHQGDYSPIRSPPRARTHSRHSVRQIQGPQLAQHMSQLNAAPEQMPQASSSISSEIRSRIDAGLQTYLAASRLINLSSADSERSAQVARAQAWQNQFRSTLPTEGIQYLEELVARTPEPHQIRQNSDQKSHHDLESADHGPQVAHRNPQASHNYTAQQREAPVTPISTALRQHIDANISAYFAAIKCTDEPTDSKNFPMQKRAQAFQIQFKSNLPPEGHQYIEEIMHRMYIDQNEGADMMRSL